MIWLGPQRGFLTDWVTQQWVRLTGHRIDLDKQSWLGGPSGFTHGIGKHFFDKYAALTGLELLPEDEPRGLVSSLADELELTGLQPEVADFYEKTSEYRIDCWSEWSLLFRPWGRLLAVLFSRRLQQLNVPLTGLDTHLGMTSRVLVLRAKHGERQTAWIRQLMASQHTLYAGSYSVCRVPGYDRACIKVCFPLPNGRAIVIMRPEVDADGSLRVISDGRRFGDPGFYFVVEHEHGAYARYVRTMKETIHVYAAEDGDVRADHEMRIFGRVFMRLHYRMTRSAKMDHARTGNTFADRHLERPPSPRLG